MVGLGVLRLTVSNNGSLCAVSDGDDDLSLGVSLFHIPDGLGDLAERVRLIDDRRHLPRLDEFLQDQQVVTVLARQKWP